MLTKATDNALEQTVTLVLAGRGERLDPLTRGRAKPIVAFGDRRIIDFTLSNCLRSGVKRPFVLTQYLPDSVHEHVRRWWLAHAADTAKSDAAPVCLPSRNGCVYAGTADALFQNIPVLAKTEYVLVLSSDHIYEMNYREMIQFHVTHGGAVTIGSVVVPQASGNRFGIMEVNDSCQVLGFEEKPEEPKTLPGQSHQVLASMGIYIFNARVLEDALRHDAALRSSQHDIGASIIPRLVSSISMYAFQFADKKTGKPLYWRDVGTLDSYYSASMECFGASGSVICKGVQTHETAEIIDSILLPGARLERGVRIRRAILDENVYVPAGASVGYKDSVDQQFTVTPKGLVVVPANTIVPLVGSRSERTKPMFSARASLRSS
jgi:glucose-1-phosphate adenylyltransferase